MLLETRPFAVRFTRFVTPLCGDMRTMPGLPEHPAAEGVDVDSEGRIVGLF